MRTAIFLKEKEIRFLERLVRDYEKRNFRSLNHNEQQEIDDLIETLFLKGVEEKTKQEVEEK